MPRSRPKRERNPKALRRAWELAGFIVLCVGVWFAISVDKYAIYRSDTPTVALKYPEDWIVVPKPTPQTLVSFISPKDGEDDQFQQNIDLAVEDLTTQPLTLGQFSDKIVKAVEATFNNGRNADLQETSVAGVPAYRYSFETTQRADMKILYVWFIKNGKGYSLSYTSLLEDHDEFADEVEVMIRSIAVP